MTKAINAFSMPDSFLCAKKSKKLPYQSIVVTPALCDIMVEFELSPRKKAINHILYSLYYPSLQVSTLMALKAVDCTCFLPFQ